MNDRLQRQRERHVVVSGAGTGIGRAIALRLAEEGARLTLLGRRLELLEEAASEARQRCGATTFTARCDVRDQGQVDAAFAAAAAALGPAHVCVANAGIGGPNEPGSADRWEDLIRTNLSGTYWTFRAAERHLAPGPSLRHFVAISSVVARFGVAGLTGYCASKTGVLGLVRALAWELAPRQVQVNAVCPGWVETEMARQSIGRVAQSLGLSWDEGYRRAMAEVPLGRWNTPQEVAGLVAWLVSGDAIGVTGQALDINGGSWMG